MATHYFATSRNVEAAGTASGAVQKHHLQLRTNPHNSLPSAHMTRKYARVKPSREPINTDTVINHFSSLHKLKDYTASHSVTDWFNPFSDNDAGSVPEFEFLVISEGGNEPVEFYYGVEEAYFDRLRRRLVTAYPDSFDVEEADIDITEKIVPPVKYDPDEFAAAVENNDVQFTPQDAELDTSAGITKGHIGRQGMTDGDAVMTGDGSSSGNDTNGSESESRLNGDNKSTTAGDTDTYHSDSHGNAAGGGRPRSDVEHHVSRESDTDVSASADIGDESCIDNSNAAPLAELDASLAGMLDPSTTIDSSNPVAAIDGPTRTEDGSILARPTLDHGTPIAATWFGDAERSKDWMTTLKMFSEVADPEADELQSRAPLATLVQHLSEAEVPIAFQVVFERMDDWAKDAEKRKNDLHLNRDTITQKITYELGELVHGPSDERRTEKRRDYFDDIGESAGGEDSVVSGDVARRAEHIDKKIPKQTFRANIRAASVATRDVPVDRIRTTMRDLASALNHLDGYFYGLKPEIAEDSEGRIRDNREATEALHRLVNSELKQGRGATRRDIVVNADELANFIAVPSSKGLTVEGVRGTRADPESRDPLPRPDPDLMDQFHNTGMRVGYALDKDAEPEPIPTEVPPRLLTKHFARFATTGAGKSVALQNDILSLYENTNGPTIVVDPKGDGFTQNYMRCHYERFGEQDLRENVIHFDVPEVLPGFTFFNIDPALDRGARRVDAIQNKADYYEELLKLVMGTERYRESKVAPTIISALIKSLFDERYAPEREGRESANYYSHHKLEQAATDLRLAVESNEHEGRIPDVQDDRIKETLSRHIKSDRRDFATIMNAVFNRLDYIREDTHLRRIFDNTAKQFDFGDHLDDDTVILFDLGDLRDEATIIMTGLILTNLWDSLTQHDQTVCAHGHDSRDECEAFAKERGAPAYNPPCREPWSDDHLVNLVVDEAASVADSDIMDKMLEQGRSFNLSVGLSMQFPEQMRDAGDRTYRNVLNNIASLLIGKITLDEEVAEALAHEDMDPEDFRNRIKALPRGEWIGQFPSPRFKETGPEPFSLDPLPVPSGHPESQNPLSDAGEEHFRHLLTDTIKQETQEQYGVPRTSYESASDSPNPNLGTGANTDPGPLGGDTAMPSGASGSGESTNSDPVTSQNPNSIAATPEIHGFDAESPPDTVAVTDTQPRLECTVCGTDYFASEADAAANCCDAPATNTAPVGKEASRGSSPQRSDTTPTDAAACANPSDDAQPSGQPTTTDQNGTAIPTDPSLRTGTDQSRPSADPRRSDDREQAPSTGTIGPDAVTPETNPIAVDPDAVPVVSTASGSDRIAIANNADPSDTKHPVRRIRASKCNGSVGEYDSAHIAEDTEITELTLDTLNTVIDTWTRSSVLAVTTALIEACRNPTEYTDTTATVTDVPTEVMYAAVRRVLHFAARNGVQKIAQDTPVDEVPAPEHGESLTVRDAYAAFVAGFTGVENRVDPVKVWKYLATADLTEIDHVDVPTPPANHDRDGGTCTGPQPRSPASSPETPAETSTRATHDGTVNENYERGDTSNPYGANTVGNDAVTVTTDITAVTRQSETAEAADASVRGEGNNPATQEQDASKSIDIPSDVSWGEHRRLQDITDSKLRELPLTIEEAEFLATLIEVYNNDAGVPRYAPHGGLSKYFADRAAEYNRRFDIEMLEAEGYISMQEARGGGLGTFYTPSKKAATTVNIGRSAGPGVGDISDSMLHRALTDLTADWITQTYDAVTTTETFTTIDLRRLPASTTAEQKKEIRNSVLDVVGYTSDNDIAVVAEIEAGATNEDVARDPDIKRPGINNYESLRGDYRLLRALPGDALWVAPDAAGAARQLGVLIDSYGDLSGTDFESYHDAVAVMDEWRLVSRFNDQILPELGLDGLDTVMTAPQLPDDS